MYAVKITNNPDGSMSAASNDYTFAIDTQGKGITPPDTLLAALGSCIAVYLKKYMHASKLELKDFEIRLEADFCKEIPVCFRKISVTVDLKGFTLDERRHQALLGFIKNCPVHTTLKANPLVELSLL